MTAPPSQMPLFADYLHPASYFSPASTGPDSTFPWPSMAPFQNQNNGPQPSPKSSGSPANESNGSNDLLFITGTSLADFKSKKNMTKVRKKAMGSYLEKEKEKKPSRTRLTSEDSTGSRTSLGSDQLETISNSDALKLLRGGNRKASRRPSSPIRSPGSSTQDQHVPSPDSQVLRMNQPVDIILPSAPIVLPMRTGIELDYDRTAPRPFQSIGRPLDPFRSMFQAHHPRVSVEELKFHCSRAFGTRAMGQHWIPTLVQSPHAFLSTLCIASAHFDAINERPVESVQTTALRQEVIHLIGQNLLNPGSRVDDFNVISLTQLIASEMIAGDETALNYHEAGVEAMIKQRGGVNRLGVNGRLASTISWVSLESAVLREAKPQSIYSDFCTSKSNKSYSNVATIPESPLYCPRTDLQTIKRSRDCIPKTLELLKDIRMMMDLFLHETKNTRQNTPTLKNLYKKITQYPSAAELQRTQVLTTKDWKYEAIRITSVIQATAIIKRVPLSEALKYAAQEQKPTSLYTSTAASKSNESLISPTTLRHDSPVTGFSTSPSYTTSPAWSQPNPFNFVPAPSATTHSSSFSSTNSDIFFLPLPAPKPTGPNALLTNLKTTIQNSDLSECWADMAGVLLWIGLTVGAASRKSEKVLRKWFSALAVRVSILLCFEHPEPIHATLLRMGEIIEAVGYSASRADTDTDLLRRENAGKKRRM